MNILLNHVSNEQRLNKYKKGRYMTRVSEESLNVSVEKKMEGGRQRQENQSGVSCNSPGKMQGL